MKKHFFLTAVSFIALLTVFASHQQVSDMKPFKKENIPSEVIVKPDLNFGKFPLYFIVNKGQVDKRAKFYAKASRYTLWLTKEGLVFDSFKKVEVNGKARDRSRHAIHSTHPLKTERNVSNLLFVNANKNPEMIALEETRLRVNYFKGNDRSKWLGNIPTSQAVLYKNLYKNIDLKVYGIEKQIEYDWIAKPGGNPGDIRFEYKNVKGTRLDREGNLLIETGFGELMHKRPDCYQLVGNNKVGVDATFKKISGNIYGFEVAEYDKRIELIIDPVVLAYSTYLGGGQHEGSNGIAVDSNGHAYVIGTTYSTDFPTINQYQGNQADYDVFITKIDTNKTGTSSLIYSTYLGGVSHEGGHGIAADSSECVYVTGYTTSSDFPTLNPYQSERDDFSSDVFVTKIDTTQNGDSSLIYSTYLGGNGDENGYGIATDSNGNAYITGETNSTNFPTIAQYKGYEGGYDVFVAKIDTTQIGKASLTYSTYLGGGEWDIGQAIAVDINENAYLTGYTESTNFPTLNQYQSDKTYFDAFITRIDTNLSGTSSLIYSSYLGGDADDRGKGIAVGNKGYVYVTGWTNSTDFPTLNQFQTFSGYDDGFITKIDTTQNGISSLIYSTYLTGDNNDRCYGISVDNIENAYVTGVTWSSNFPTLNQYQTDQGNSDVFVTRIDTTQSGAACLIYSTYLGGDDWDEGYGIAVDNLGNVYVTG